MQVTSCCHHVNTVLWVTKDEWWEEIDTILGFQVRAWASYQIRIIASCACAGNTGNGFPCGLIQRSPLVSDLGMHHGTCVTHVPWCMSGSLTRGTGENVSGILGACASAILRIWQDGHGCSSHRPCLGQNYTESKVSWGQHETHGPCYLGKHDIIPSHSQSACDCPLTSHLQ